MHKLNGIWFAVALVALTALTSAITLQSSLDTATITDRTQGNAFVWVVNEFNTPATLSFAANAPHLTVTLDKPQQGAAANAAAGTVLRFGAPTGFRGTDDITLTVQACTAANTCTTATRKLQVSVAAPAIDGGSDGVASRFVKPASTGTQVVYGAYFDPTSYDVDFQSRTTCKKLQVGQYVSEKVLLLNRGAAGSFDLRALGDNHVLDAEVTPGRIALQRNEAGEVWLRTFPRQEAAGQRSFVTLQLLAPNGALVAERDMCFDVENTYSAKLLVPTVTQVTNCAPATLKVTVQNTGTTSDAYQITGERVVGVAPEDRIAGPGETLEATLTLDTTNLVPGRKAIKLTATSLGGAQGVGTTTLDVKACEQIAKSTAEPAQPSQVRVTVEVHNEFNRTLTNLTASVQGLPSGWEVLTPIEPLSLVPNETRNVTLTVRTPNGDEAKDAFLVLKEGDVTIARQKLPTISSKASGLSGLFTAASSNGWAIALVVVVALVVLVLTGRLRLGDEPEQTDDEREEYMRKLRNIRDQVERGERFHGHSR